MVPYAHYRHRHRQKLQALIEQALTDAANDPLTPGSSCANPSFTEVCNLDDIDLGIEVGLAPLGCVYDANDDLVGKVFLCKTVDEESGAITWDNVLVNIAGGAPVTGYTGAWEKCREVSLARELISVEEIPFTDAADISLTAPAGAVMAEIDVVGGDILKKLDAAVTGRFVNDQTTFELESPSEMSALLVRGATGSTGSIVVHYYTNVDTTSNN